MDSISCSPIMIELFLRDFFAVANGIKREAVLPEPGGGEIDFRCGQTHQENRQATQRQIHLHQRAIAKAHPRDKATQHADEQQRHR